MGKVAVPIWTIYFQISFIWFCVWTQSSQWVLGSKTTLSSRVWHAGILFLNMLVLSSGRMKRYVRVGMDCSAVLYPKRTDVFVSCEILVAGCQSGRRWLPLECKGWDAANVWFVWTLEYTCCQTKSSTNFDFPENRSEEWSSFRYLLHPI